MADWTHVARNPPQGRSVGVDGDLFLFQRNIVRMAKRQLRILLLHAEYWHSLSPISGELAAIPGVSQAGEKRRRVQTLEKIGLTHRLELPSIRNLAGSSRHGETLSNAR